MGIAVGSQHGNIYEGLFENGVIKEPYLKTVSYGFTQAYLNTNDGREYQIHFS